MYYPRQVRVGLGVITMKGVLNTPQSYRNVTSLSDAV